MSELHELGLGEAAAAIRARRVRAGDLARHLAARIAAHDGELRCFLALNEHLAAEADRVDARLDAGEVLGPLAGVPIAIKDNMVTRSLPTTCGSRILAGYRPPYDAHVVERLTAAGALVLGKTNLDEFAMGSSTESSAFGPTANPWDTGRSPGGSSGGSAAAVAARLAPAALGSDTGGSVRQPASFCGVVGLKPTYGRISRWGLVAFGSSLDQVGTLTRSASDAALLLSILAGHDPRDGTSTAGRDEDEDGVAIEGMAGLRIGIPSQYLDGVDDDVREVVDRVVARARDAGAVVIPVELPSTRYAIAAYYVVATSEASSNLARYDGVGFGQRADGDTIDDMYLATRTSLLGDEVKRRILLGTFCLSAGYYDAYYDKAQRVRTIIRREFERAFDSVDVLLGPTSPVPPFRIGEKRDDPLSMYLCDALTVPVSLAGLPALSLPAGFVERDGARLPVGAQIIAPAGRDAVLLQAAAALEDLLGANEENPRP